MLNSPLILASASPRRAELLSQCGFVFSICPTEIDEKVWPHENPEQYVLRLAKEKALTIAKKSQAPSLIIGADTVVVFHDEILGKPRDQDDARQMLHKLSGQTHQVFTGFAIIRSPQEILTMQVEKSTVEFDLLTERQVNEYIQTGEPMDKAGSYAIQGLARTFAHLKQGLLSNVIGLPIEKIGEFLTNNQAQKN